MPQDIHRHFATLGLNPGASAGDIRTAYRRLVQEWHPDRFAAGSLMQTTAEDQTKDLNEAYEWLYKKRHYRRFLAEGKKVRNPARGADPDAGASESGEGKGAAPKKPPRRPPKTGAPPFRSRRLWRTTAVAAGLAAALFITIIWIRSAPLARAAPGAEAPRSAPPAPPASVAAPAAPPAAETGRPPSARIAAPEMPVIRPLRDEPRTFALPERAAPAAIATGLAEAAMPVPSVERPAAIGLGNSPSPSLPIRPPGISLPADPPEAPALSGEDLDTRLDEAETQLETFDIGDASDRVRIVQGSPDEAVEGVFRYGSSMVFFDKGRVSGWTNGVPRLRVPSLSFADLQDEIDAFTVGSTRGEVFEIQGRPDAASPDAYFYGSDAVYFENDRVASWTRTGGRLRTRLLPELPFFDPHLGR
jgi:hypothetical protein